MIRLAWFVVILTVLIRLVNLKIDVKIKDNPPAIIVTAIIIIVLFVNLCTIIVTLDLLRWLYPLLH